MSRAIIFLCFAILTAVIFISCSDNSPVTPSNNDPSETVIEQQSSVVGSSGGSITLSDGSGIEISPGIVSSSASITIKRIKNDTYFSGDNRNVVDISSDKPISEYKLKIKVPEGLTIDNVGLFGYDPDNVDSIMKGAAPAYLYDKVGGYITATISNSTTSKDNDRIQGSLLFPRWVAEWDQNIEGTVETKIIEMPFYEQPGSSCWATCATMLSKAYMPYTDRYKEVEVYNYLKYLQIDRDDGIYPYQFLRSLNKAFHYYTGAGVETTGYFRVGGLKEKLIKELDLNHPVILSLPYPGVNGAHAIMVVGYIKKTSGTNKVDYELIIHNPQATGSETMYTVHPIDYVFKNKSAVVAVQMLYPKEVPHPDKSLLTLGLPLNAVGYIKFKVPFKTSSYYINFQQDISKSSGYGWKWGSKDMTAIPDSATELSLNLPIWNADQTSSDRAKIEVNIWNKGSKVYKFEDYIDVPAKTVSAVWFTKTIAVKDFIKQDSSLYELEVKLWGSNGSEYSDGFKIDMSMIGSSLLDGNWRWIITPVSDGCHNWSSQGEDIDYNLKVTKDKIRLWKIEDDDGGILNFEMNGSNFKMSYAEGTDSFEVAGKMTNNDAFTADITIKSTREVVDDKGNKTDVPCTSVGKISATRIK